MGAIVQEVLRAADHFGFRLQVLDADQTAPLWHRLAQRFGEPGRGRRLWEQLSQRAAVQDPDAWCWIANFLSDEPVLMLFDPSDEVVGVRFAHGSQVVPVLAESFGFEFYVTNEQLEFLLCFNHHDFLIAAGSAKAWLENVQLKPPT
jgi:hypothetical protein